ncbi:MAG: sulfite exporter TauE/SafE family protein [Phycisphaerales bacterium]|nr:sulfite exporter TauE/SafE family protein [Phycisphaerales bacterium]
MPEKSTISPLTTRTFRQRVLRPTEGVFLFHPRMLQRLIHRYLGDGSPNRSIPPLGYYLIPREILLIGLEDENPDALSIIEGLNLPDWVILLPMPSAQELAAAPPEQWLRIYWGRRFAAEVTRTWQTLRHDNQDQGTFGVQGLIRCIGERAMCEARILLEQDQRVVMGLDDEALCRHFTGFATYLRYFVPGARAYFFPAIQDWGVLDQWLKNGGLDLPPPRHSSRWPQLLTRSRPSGFDGVPDYEPELPLCLPFGRSDPDLADGTNTLLPLRIKPAPCSEETGTEHQTNRTLAERERIAALIESRCRKALQKASTLKRKSGRIASIRYYLTRRLILVADRFATRLQRWSIVRDNEVLLKWALGTRLRLFRQSVRTAFRAEMTSRYGTALRYLCVALHQYQKISDIFPPPSHAASEEKDASDSIVDVLEKQQEELVEALAHNLAATWKLDTQSTEVLEHLIQHLLDESDTARLSSPYSRLLHDLERIFLEGQTDYYRWQPLVWLRSFGQQPLRLGLPFQGPLKALRALNAARTSLNRLPWLGAKVSYFSAPLRTLDDRIGQQLRQQIMPRLRDLLDAAGFPANHLRQRVARNAIQEQLLDIIQRHWHLRFSDLRDTVARSSLRLPDPNWRTLLLGDRLVRFDRQASIALPGVYQPGEFYLMGLQQLSAPLFGTTIGRWITRFILVPFGSAFVGLEALSYMTNLMLTTHSSIHLDNPILVLGVGAGLIFILHTQKGQAAMLALRRGYHWLLETLHRRLAWWRRGQMTYWLQHPLIQKISRYLFEPLLIGLMFVLPLMSIASSFDLGIAKSPEFLLILGFILGSLLRNSQAGRRVWDGTITHFTVFWRQMHRNLLRGLIRWVIDLFEWLMHDVEQRLHRADEAVSHHRNEGRSITIIKLIFGPPWRVLSYLIHFYAAVLIEPQINPIKHFPVVLVADKLMLPFFPVLTATLLAVLDPILPRFLSLPLTTVTVLLSPALFGFLGWELMENWKLYRANHPNQVQAVHFGLYRETLYTLLRPGFHSGALPKAFAELRQLIRLENRQEQPCSQHLRQVEAQLREILESVQALMTRQWVFALLERCREIGYEQAEGVIEHLAVTASTLNVRVVLYLFGQEEAAKKPVLLDLHIDLRGNELQGEFNLEGACDDLGVSEKAWLQSETDYFLKRATHQG